VRSLVDRRGRPVHHLQVGHLAGGAAVRHDDPVEAAERQLLA
jgi:hypothetical protein